MNTKKPAIYWVTLSFSVIVFILSVFSLVYPNVYTERINRITSYELMGQDFVTAIVSFLFTGVILFSDSMKLQIKAIWLGCITYFFYIYAYFSFGGISSVFY